MRFRPVITRKYTVLRWTHRYTYESRQELWRYTLFLGMPIWCKKLDEEDIPAWALIQMACLGSTDWRSKFAGHMENYR